MKLKERLAFMALGGLLVFMGQPGCGGDDHQTKNETTEQTSTTPKSDESIDIELEKILPQFRPNKKRSWVSPKALKAMPSLS